jgi:hypothetical protein
LGSGQWSGTKLRWIRRGEWQRNVRTCGDDRRDFHTGKPRWWKSVTADIVHPHEARTTGWCIVPELGLSG